MSSVFFPFLVFVVLQCVNCTDRLVCMCGVISSVLFYLSSLFLMRYCFMSTGFVFLVFLVL